MKENLINDTNNKATKINIQEKSSISSITSLTPYKSQDIKIEESPFR